MKKLNILLVPAIVLLSTVGALAQDKPKSDTEGLFLNFHMNGSSWDLSDDTDLGELPRESGGGMGLAFGYGASQTVTLFMAFDAARISGNEDRNDYNLVHFDIGAMVTLLGQSSRFRPFGKVSYTARTAEFELDNTSFSSFGSGFTAGAGLMVFIVPALAITADAQATWGSMTEITTDNISVSRSIGAQSSRLNAGLTWFPGN